MAVLVPTIFAIFFHKSVNNNKLKVNQLDCLLAFFFIWSFSSILWSVNTAEAIINACVHNSIILVYFTLRLFLRDNYQLKTYFLRSISVIALLLSTFFVIEGLYWLIKLFVEIGYFTNITYGASLLLVHKNTYSNFLLLLACFILYGLNNSFYKKKLRYWAIVVLGLTAFIIITYQSRTALLGLGAIAVCYLFFANYSVKKKLLITTAAFLMGSVILLSVSLILDVSLFTFFEKLDLSSVKSNSTLFERLALWDRTSELIEQHPLLGVGAGNWIIMLPSVGLLGIKTVAENNFLLTHPHNDFLWIFSELGIIGLLTYLSIFTLIIYTSFKKVGNLIQPKTVTFLVLTFSIAYLLFSCFTSPYNLLFFNALLVLILVQLNFKTILLNVNVTTLKKILLTLSFLLIIPLIINSNSHFKMQQLRVEKDTNNWHQVFEVAKNSENFFFNTTSNGIPSKFYMANAAQQLGNKKQAIQLLQQALKTHPNNLAVLSKLGNINKQLSNFNKAKKYYQEALMINPQNKFLTLQLSEVLINLKEYNKAQNWLEGIKDSNKRKQRLLKQIEKTNSN